VTEATGAYSATKRDARLAYAPRMRMKMIGAVALVLVGATACPDHGPPTLKQEFGTPAPIRPESNGEVAFLLGSGGILGPSPLYVVGPGTEARRIGIPGDLPLTDFAWSPDGSTIAYLVSAGEGSGGSIDVVDADGSGNRTLVRSSTPLSGISWSPDGQWIVYGQGIAVAPKADNRYRLFARPTGGGAPLMLTHGPDEGLLPTWSPEGTRIAYLALSPPFQPHTAASLMVMNADGLGATTVLRASGLHMSGPAWSPDGRWLAVVEGQDLRLVRLDGSGSHVIYRCRGDCTSRAPRWSPDGSQIALTVYHGGRWRIRTITPTGKRVPVPAGLLPRACCLAWQPVPR
jgi:dipeptidyl aminopeptidase/acylaminoacyl peptidase